MGQKKKIRMIEDCDYLKVRGTRTCTTTVQYIIISNIFEDNIFIRIIVSCYNLHVGLLYVVCTRTCTSKYVLYLFISYESIMKVRKYFRKYN